MLLVTIHYDLSGSFLPVPRILALSSLTKLRKCVHYNIPLESRENT